MTNDILLNNLTGSGGGATARSNMITYGNNRRSAMRAGDKLIGLTAIARGAASGWTAGNETARLLGNSSLIASMAPFDAIADVASIPELQDPTNKAYFEQTTQTHLTDLGYQLIWQKVLPVIQSVLPTPA